MLICDIKVNSQYLDPIIHCFFHPGICTRRFSDRSQSSTPRLFLSLLFLCVSVSEDGMSDDVPLNFVRSDHVTLPFPWMSFKTDPLLL